MPTQPHNREKFFTALDESFKAILDAVKSGNERGYRFSKRLIHEVEEGQQELARLGRRFARQPKDLRGLYQESVDLARRTASHSALLAREWAIDAGAAGREARETAQKVIHANRAAAQALAATVRAATREFARSARQRVQARMAARRPVRRRRATRARARPTTRRTTGQPPSG